jgi:hypothetical protein
MASFWICWNFRQWFEMGIYYGVKSWLKKMYVMLLEPWECIWWESTLSDYQPFW